MLWLTSLIKLCQLEYYDVLILFLVSLLLHFLCASLSFYLSTESLIITDQLGERVIDSYTINQGYLFTLTCGIDVGADSIAWSYSNGTEGIAGLYIMHLFISFISSKFNNVCKFKFHDIQRW